MWILSLCSAPASNELFSMKLKSEFLLVQLIKYGCFCVGPVAPDLNLTGSIFKMLLERREVLKEIASSSTLLSTRRQAFKDSMTKGILNASDNEVSFETFPYF